MDLPIVLYDISQKVLNKHQIVKTSNFYFYSYGIISVEIVSGNATLYSVKEDLQVNTGLSFNDNFGYTLLINDNLSSVKLKITFDNKIEYYTIQLILDNVIDDTYGNSHYNNLLVNYNLPTFNELQQAIPEEFNNKYELIKRLLLEFKGILKYKGTKKSIEEFFNFLGFVDSQLNITEEFKTKSGETILSKTNYTDVKLAIYRLLYNNYETNGLDAYNLPVNTFIIENIVGFKDNLVNAIVLANKYFTVEEQTIKFFGLQYSSNIYKFVGITSLMTANFNNDVLGFRKQLNIKLSTKTSETDINKIVDNCLQYSTNLFKTEIKVIKPEPYTTQLFFVAEEIFDNTEIELDPDYILFLFGIALHIDIYSPLTYVTISLRNTITNAELVSDKIFVETSLNKIISIVDAGTDYICTVTVTDVYNNTEKYFYNLKSELNINRIDFDVFNSGSLNTDISESDINSDVDSPSILSGRQSLQSVNYIKHLSDVSLELSEYYNIEPSNVRAWLLDNTRYELPDVNLNTKLSEITETIPTKYIDGWLNIISFVKPDNHVLKLRIYDETTYSTTIIELSEIIDYPIVVNKLYICVMDIFERDEYNNISETTTPYYFITTTEVGINITQTLFDFVLVSAGNEVISIYDEETFNSKKIPVNYDFPLFAIGMQCHISDDITNDIGIIETIPYVHVKSILPLLKNINLFSTNYLKIGDIFYCRLNNDYVINERNLIWRVFDSFTNELLFETKDLALKYRINNKTCYDIKCSFVIDGKSYEIFKKSIITSFINATR